MNLYTSDLHFGHSNVILFDGRPFVDREEMDKCLIKLWNGRVDKEDHVYILGDFAYRNDKDFCWYLRQMKGHKHLVVGNHDGKLVHNEKAMAYFDSADIMMHITDTLNGENIKLHLCHFPILSWDGKEHGSWHIYGHIHNSREEDVCKVMLQTERALNAGCMVNNYAPASIKELICNNERMRRE